MKRFICLVCILCLLCASALAEEYEDSDLSCFESRFGYTLWYQENELTYWTEEWEEEIAECFCPWEDQTGNAYMVCLGSRFSMMFWDDYTRISLGEPDADLSYPFEMTAFTDGDVIMEQWIVSAADSDYVFIIQYQTGDPQGWSAVLHSLLETLEFPAQPAVTKDFLLDYFQGGAAGMQFIDVVYDEDADPITLVPYRDMWDFALEALTWDDETFTVSEAVPLYTASPLSPGENLNVYCFFGDVLPSLRIRYTDESGEPQCFYIFQSGRDGSLLLLLENGL